MLKKIIAIKNVGRFRNSSASGNTQLAKHTFIVGANGYGKTTICSVLRSLQSGETSHVLGRKTLGVNDPVTVDLLFDTGAVRFDGTAWPAPRPGIAIFDGVFVADNVHSGEVVDIAHKRNLYRVIVGEDGVKLAAEDTALATQSRAKTTEISTAAKAIQPHLPPGMKLEAFIALTPDEGIDAKIDEQTRLHQAALQAATIEKTDALATFAIAELPANLPTLLAQTIDGISKDAEDQLSAHIAKHAMGAAGENWISEGIGYTDDTCAFCGQDVKGLPLIGAFRAIFSEQYDALKTEIAETIQKVLDGFGPTAVAKLQTVAAQNGRAGEFWKQYCDFNSDALNLPANFNRAMEQLCEAAVALLDRKAIAPLEPLATNKAFNVALANYKNFEVMQASINEAIGHVNGLIAEKKKTSANADVKGAEAELAKRKATKTRHLVAVAALCDAHTKLSSEKTAVDKQKEAVRKKLDTHTQNVVKPYELQINAYLDRFNAGFTITETTHGYPGGIASSSYQLVINNTPIDVGDGNTPANQPSFKNTLSAGDKTTLALAFFLAHLERDQGIGDKIVVFDDPFNSQDAFRRRQTVHEIISIAKRSKQIIVLSHDATFLKQVWDKSPPADRAALSITDHRSQGSKITEVDLEKACQGRTASDIDDLQTYITSGAGGVLDIVRKMRVVLEAHCRTTYPASFAATDWLGDMARKIRDGGDTHPAAALYDEIDQINGYTSQYHHGENVADATPDQIDATELTGFARRTLKIVNALQA